MPSYEVNKTYTDNPFVDLLLYYSKILAFGAVIKNQQNAENEETAESMSNGDILIACVEGTEIFDLFDYDEEELRQVGINDQRVIDDYIKDKYRIPVEYRDLLKKLAAQKFIDNYTEYNNYYRMLCGLPDIGDYGIPIRDYEYLMPDGNIWNATYIHEIGTDGCKLLDSLGIIDQIKDDYPQYKYLDYLTCGITPYKARKAYEFQLLYLPEIEDSIVQDQFEEEYEKNRLYVISTFYSDAFKLSSPYYTNFIEILILLLTITDIIAEIQSDIIKKDVLDERCVQYIFEMYGVPYYKSIPLKLQKRICKNLNLLIMDKSSAQCMFDLISLFGANTVTIFKYFLLKDRLIDQWGDYVYNQIIEKTSKVNDVLENTKVDLDNPKTDTIKIPFPFEHFLEKGNVMVVWADGVKLEEGTDYVVQNYDELVSVSDTAKNCKKFTFDFYYDVRTIDNDYVNVDTKHAIHVSIKTTTLTESNVIKYALPYNTYLLDGNEIIVSIGGTWLNKNQYVIDQSKNTITINESYGTLKDGNTRNVTLIFIYGDNVKSRYSRVPVTVKTENQTNFDVPEPFVNYVSDGNCFFITIGNTFIEQSRYTVKDNKLTFTDSTLKLKPGREVVFNFIYSYESIYTKIEIKDEWEVITATEAYQFTFELHPPIQNYIGSGYKIYCKIHGNYLDEELFDVYYNTLAFRTQSIGLQPGEQLEVEYVYGPFDANTGMPTNIAIKKTFLVGTQDKQQVFTDVPFPKEEFFVHNGALIVDLYGVHLIEGKDYTIDEATKTLTLLDEDVYVNKDRRINLTFLYNVESSNAVKIQEYHTVLTQNGQSEFPVELPFYPYYQTGNGYIVIYDSLIVDPSQITLTETGMTITGLDTKKGNSLIVLFFFNNKYLTETNSLLTVEEKTIKVTDAVDNDLCIDIPLPFDDFIEHGWPYFVDNNKNYIDPSLYYDINNKFSFVNTNDYLRYDNLTFTFIYINDGEYLTIKDSEDNLKDFELKFIGVPLSEDDWNHNKYIMAKQNVLPYDTTTLEDIFWDGVGAEDDIVTAHERVKLAIISQKFNYERTKYFGLNHVFDIAEMSFQISYFYNLIFDDWLKEELLTVELPNISSGVPYKIGYIFSYLIALSYLYQDIDDTIMDIPSKITYVKGFNMHADLEKLKQYILDQRRKPEDYDVWDFEIPMEQLTDVNQLADLFRNNRDVYNRVVNGMYHCRNHDIYVIWKKLFDSLMVWDYNLKYFTLNDGTIAPTYSAFIQEKAPGLYRDFMQLSEIDDKDARNSAIIDRIDGVVYILEQYFNSDEFEHIYDKFPGVSQEALMNYVYTMIDFFKSYKITLRSKGDYINFSLKDPSMTAINITDNQKMHVDLLKLEYIYLEEYRASTMSTIKDDAIGIREKLTIAPLYENGTRIPVHIIQTPHQTIYVYDADGNEYTHDFDVAYGTEIYCYIEADEGYNPGILSMTYGVITEETTVTATAVSGTVYNVEIVQSDHQTITVIYGEYKYTNSLQVLHGDSITVIIEAEPGFTAGTLNFTGGVITESKIITSTPAIPNIYTIKVESADNQTVVCNLYASKNITWSPDLTVTEGNSVSDTFYGYAYEIVITPDQYYEAGTCNYPLTGNVTGDMDIIVTSALVHKCNVTIIPSENQTIAVTVDSVTYTESFQIPVNSIYVAQVIPDDGYLAGKLNQDENGVITTDMIFQATPAKANNLQIIVDGQITFDKQPDASLDLSDWAWISVQKGARFQQFGYNFDTNQWELLGGDLGVGTQDNVVVTFHYSDEALIYYDFDHKNGMSYTYTVDDNVTINVDVEATLRHYYLIIQHTEHQTVYVDFDTGNSYHSEVDEDVYCDEPYGSKFSAYIIPDEGYIAGEITIEDYTGVINITSAQKI